MLFYLLQYKESKIIFHSEYMLCEMLFDWYNVQSVNHDSYTGYNTLLKELIKHINWNILNLSSMLLLFYFVLFYFIYRSKEEYNRSIYN